MRADQPAYLTPDEVCRIFAVSRKTVERWLVARELEHVKVHRVVRISAEGAAEFAARRTVRAKGGRVVMGTGFEEGSEFWGRMERLIEAVVRRQQQQQQPQERAAA